MLPVLVALFASIIRRVYFRLRQQKRMSTAPPIVNMIVLQSPDIDRAVRFYQAMGLPFTKHRRGSEPEYYASEVNGFIFEIFPLGAAASAITTRVAFSVDDIDSVVELLLDVGGELLSSPTESDWGRRAIMKDADGHTIELVTPPHRDRTVASSKTSTSVIDGFPVPDSIPKTLRCMTNSIGEPVVGITPKPG